MRKHSPENARGRVAGGGGGGVCGAALGVDSYRLNAWILSTIWREAVLIAVAVLPAICGVSCALAMPASGELKRSFSWAKVSMATALICPGKRVMNAASWSSSTMPPPAVLIRIEPGRIWLNAVLPNRPRVRSEEHTSEL